MVRSRTNSHGQLFLAVIAFLIPVSVANARPSVAQISASVILDSKDDRIALSAGEGKAVEGKVGVTNLTSAPLAASVTGVAEEIKDCGFMVAPEAIPAGRKVEMKITSDSCRLPTNGAKAQLVFGVNQKIDVTLVPKEEPAELGSTSIGLWFAISALIALVAAGIIWSRRPRVAVAGAADALSGEPVKFEDDVPGVTASWKLGESWASNLTLIATSFAALFGATSVLEVILGEEPKVAAARILVASAATALLTAAAPLALKAFGKTSSPTVGGLIVAAWLTLTGAFGQLATVAWSLFKTGADLAFRAGGIAVATAAAIGLFCYAVKTIGILFNEAFKKKEPEAPDADLVAAAAYLYARAGEDPQAAAEAVGLLSNALKAASAEDPSSYPETSSLRRWTSPGDSRLKSGVL